MSISIFSHHTNDGARARRGANVIKSMADTFLTHAERSLSRERNAGQQLGGRYNTFSKNALPRAVTVGQRRASLGDVEMGRSVSCMSR